MRNKCSGRTPKSLTTDFREWGTHSENNTKLKDIMLIDWNLTIINDMPFTFTYNE